MTIRQIAVIGGGTMGNGIAHAVAQGGRSVRIVDVSPDMLQQALQTINRNVDRQVKKGTLSEEERSNVLARITIATDLEGGVEDADLVVEAVPEKPALKYDIFEKLDAAAPPGAILATNTSSISITQIAAR